MMILAKFKGNVKNICKMSGPICSFHCSTSYKYKKLARDHGNNHNSDSCKIKVVRLEDKCGSENHSSSDVIERYIREDYKYLKMRKRRREGETRDESSCLEYEMTKTGARLLFRRNETVKNGFDGKPIINS